MAKKNGKEKGKGLVALVRAELAKGVTDVDKIVKRTGAAEGTVRTQMYKYKKEKK